MAGFTKLFSSIVTSSIWVESDKVLRVWIAMLATCDANGRVEGSIPGFASLSRVSEQEMREAIELLSSPDQESRTPDEDGRRIVKIDGGWKIINYGKYRDRGQGKEGSRAPYMREYRKITRNNCNSDTVTRSTEAEAEAEEEVEEEAINIVATNIDSVQVEKLYEKLQFSEFNYCVYGSGVIDGKGWVARMLDFFGAERIEAGIESFTSWYGKKSLPFPNKKVIREKLWQWIERQEDPNIKPPLKPLSPEEIANQLDNKRILKHMGKEFVPTFKPEQIEDPEIRKEFFGEA